MFYIYVSFVFELIFSFFIKNFTVLLYFRQFISFLNYFIQKKILYNSWEAFKRVKVKYKFIEKFINTILVPASNKSQFKFPLVQGVPAQISGVRRHGWSLHGRRSRL